MTLKEFVWSNQNKEIPVQDFNILTGIKPKYKCKNKFLQKILIKIFGYVPIYETRRAKVIINKPEDYPFGNLDSNFTFTIEENN